MYLPEKLMMQQQHVRRVSLRLNDLASPEQHERQQVRGRSRSGSRLVEEHHDGYSSGDWSGEEFDDPDHHQAEAHGSIAHIPPTNPPWTSTARENPPPPPLPPPPPPPPVAAAAAAPPSFVRERGHASPEKKQKRPSLLIRTVGSLSKSFRSRRNKLETENSTNHHGNADSFPPPPPKAPPGVHVSSTSNRRLDERGPPRSALGPPPESSEDDPFPKAELRPRSTPRFRTTLMPPPLPPGRLPFHQRPSVREQFDHPDSSAAQRLNDHSRQSKADAQSVSVRTVVPDPSSHEAGGNAAHRHKFLLRTSNSAPARDLNAATLNPPPGLPPPGLPPPPPPPPLPPGLSPPPGLGHRSTSVVDLSGDGYHRSVGVVKMGRESYRHPPPPPPPQLRLPKHEANVKMPHSVPRAPPHQAEVSRHFATNTGHGASPPTLFSKQRPMSNLEHALQAELRPSLPPPPPPPLDSQPSTSVQSEEKFSRTKVATSRDKRNPAIPPLLRGEQDGNYGSFSKDCCSDPSAPPLPPGSPPPRAEDIAVQPRQSLPPELFAYLPRDESAMPPIPLAAQHSSLPERSSLSVGRPLSMNTARLPDADEGLPPLPPEPPLAPSLSQMNSKTPPQLHSVPGIHSSAEDCSDPTPSLRRQPSFPPPPPQKIQAPHSEEAKSVTPCAPSPKIPVKAFEQNEVLYTKNSIHAEMVQTKTDGFGSVPKRTSAPDCSSPMHSGHSAHNVNRLDLLDTVIRDAAGLRLRQSVAAERDSRDAERMQMLRLLFQEREEVRDLLKEGRIQQKSFANSVEAERKSAIVELKAMIDSEREAHNRDIDNIRRGMQQIEAALRAKDEKRTSIQSVQLLPSVAIQAVNSPEVEGDATLTSQQDKVVSPSLPKSVDGISTAKSSDSVPIKRVSQPPSSRPPPLDQTTIVPPPPSHPPPPIGKAELERMVAKFGDLMLDSNSCNSEDQGNAVSPIDHLPTENAAAKPQEHMDAEAKNDDGDRFAFLLSRPSTEPKPVVHQSPKPRVLPGAKFTQNGSLRPNVSRRNILVEDKDLKSVSMATRIRERMNNYPSGGSPLFQDNRSALNLQRYFKGRRQGAASNYTIRTELNDRQESWKIFCAVPLERPPLPVERGDESGASLHESLRNLAASQASVDLDGRVDAILQRRRARMKRGNELSQDISSTSSNSVAPTKEGEHLRSFYSQRRVVDARTANGCFHGNGREKVERQGRITLGDLNSESREATDLEMQASNDDIGRENPKFDAVSAATDEHTEDLWKRLQSSVQRRTMTRLQENVRNGPTNASRRIGTLVPVHGDPALSAMVAASHGALRQILEPLVCGEQLSVNAYLTSDMIVGEGDAPNYQSYGLCRCWIDDNLQTLTWADPKKSTEGGRLSIAITSIISIRASSSQPSGSSAGKCGDGLQRLRRLGSYGGEAGAPWSFGFELDAILPNESTHGGGGVQMTYCYGAGNAVQQERWMMGLVLLGNVAAAARASVW